MVPPGGSSGWFLRVVPPGGSSGWMVRCLFFIVTLKGRSKLVETNVSIIFFEADYDKSNWRVFYIMFSADNYYSN